MTALDLSLIHDYTGGINVPVASQAGYDVRVDTAGTNIEFVSIVQELAGTGSWNGESRTLLVRGSGIRTVTLPLPTDIRIGFELLIIDADGTASAGAITVSFTGATLATGVPVIAADYSRLRVTYVDTGVWQLTT
jgi:hypothetical protein